MLEAMAPDGADNGKTMWLVLCDCGRVKRMVGSELTKGKQKSCGCKRGELISQRIRTHGMSAHPAYAVWRSMHDRCRLPTHKAYANYGGRGIHVCPEWGSFEGFWSDMQHGYERGLSLERADNAKGYSPNNCYWATREEQASNRRTARVIDTPLGRMSMAEACRRSGLKHTTLAYRVNSRWPTEDLFLPLDESKRWKKSTT